MKDLKIELQKVATGPSLAKSPTPEKDVVPVTICKC